MNFTDEICFVKYGFALDVMYLRYSSVTYRYCKQINPKISFLQKFHPSKIIT